MYPITSVASTNQTNSSDKGHYHRAESLDADTIPSCANEDQDFGSYHGTTSIPTGPNDNDTLRYIMLRLLHSILSGLNYGVALLLMLVAMTYNPSLFIALMIGYAVGDFLFFARTRPSSITECH